MKSSERDSPSHSFSYSCIDLDVMWCSPGSTPPHYKECVSLHSKADSCSLSTCLVVVLSPRRRYSHWVLCPTSPHPLWYSSSAWWCPASKRCNVKAKADAWNWTSTLVTSPCLSLLFRHRLICSTWVIKSTDCWCLMPSSSFISPSCSQQAPCSSCGSVRKSPTKASEMVSPWSSSWVSSPDSHQHWQKNSPLASPQHKVVWWCSW